MKKLNSHVNPFIQLSRRQKENLLGKKVEVKVKLAKAVKDRNLFYHEILPQLSQEGWVVGFSTLWWGKIDRSRDFNGRRVSLYRAFFIKRNALPCMKVIYRLNQKKPVSVPLLEGAFSFL